MSVPERQLRRGGDKIATVQSQSQSPRVAQLGRVPVTPRLPGLVTSSPSRQTTSFESPQGRFHDGEGFSTPVLASIASNVTPRSSARQHRGRNQGTPSAKTSPSESHLSPSLRKSEVHFDGFFIQSPVAGNDASSPIANAPTEPFKYPRVTPKRAESSDEPKFFRAARPDSGEGPAFRRLSELDNGKFVTVGQVQAQAQPQNAPPGYRLTKTASVPTGPGFFYANEVPSMAASTSSLPAKQEEASGPRLISRHRKAASVVLGSPPKSNPLPETPDIGPRVLPRIAPAGHVRGNSMSPQSSRRSSLSPETTLATTNGPLPFLLDRKDAEGPPTETLASFTLASILSADSPDAGPDAYDDNASSASEVTPARPRMGLASAPTIPKEDFAANARRERKILDLEISNNSLLAINRSLEREMRKQHAELRRYKRLSRSGRLSLTPANGVTPESQPEAISEESSAEDSELSESDGETLDTSVYEDSLQDVALRRAARDEKRVREDLEQHRELLIASQQMNQSLKRCLGWTDELIRQGRRALEYSVRLSEVGGRVLSPDEVEESSRNDGFFSTQSDKLLPAKERDSGIDM